MLLYSLIYGLVLCKWGYPL